MAYLFRPLLAADARHIETWRYPPPYNTYTMEGSAGELLDTRSPFFAGFDERGELAGYVCFGTAAEVGWSGEPRLWTEGRELLSIGLGLRPDLTGQGRGPAFFASALELGRKQFAPHVFRLFVLPWNERAIRVYERAGFERTGARTINAGSEQERAFIEMRRLA